MSDFFTHLNTAKSIPKNGSTIAIMTKKSGHKIILCKVKGLVNGNELILNKSTNSFFNWDMYMAGESWVWRVWDLGEVQLTASLNNTNSLANF